MLCASEANKSTKRYIMDKCNKELEDIEKEITCASMKGNYSFSKDGVISKETRKCLEDLGYKITTGQ